MYARVGQGEHLLARVAHGLSGHGAQLFAQRGARLMRRTLADDDAEGQTRDEGETGEDERRTCHATHHDTGRRQNCASRTLTTSQTFKTTRASWTSVVTSIRREAMQMRPQPMLSVRDVPAASAWYQTVLGAVSGHGGADYEQLIVDGVLVQQLHRIDEAHHHGLMADPAAPLGNGVAVWFETASFAEAVERARSIPAEVVTDVHVNPNAGHREYWLRDLDGYLVVLAEPYDDR